MAKIEWKTQEEIEEEQNKPKEPSDKERISAMEEALMQLIMEGGI
ncbi:hypothetical protein [Senegalia massiliensis]|nr:hypothetical protein [Senegalia massiliensis]